MYSTSTPNCGMGGGSPEISTVGPAMTSGCPPWSCGWEFTLLCRVEWSVVCSDANSSGPGATKCPLSWFCRSHLLILDSVNLRDSHSTHLGAQRSWSTVTSGSDAFPFGTETTPPFPTRETSSLGWAAHLIETLRNKGLFTFITL